ncbi:ATP-binding protein [Guyparkeria hydrothermalis]|uniref:sensor histidine kinase n=1 Tax=Guyparkeria hydrothermalis TaxID=923 RepID=UPI002020DC65|nr:ATP-binding protein [Guyparkeria hydrothermalis]MCL7744881.1 ATP-binding protein [Guyparkeria hydrothermalis]
MASGTPLIHPAGEENWRGLRLANAYRLLLALALTAAALTDRGPALFGQTHPSLFMVTAWTYLFLAMAFEWLLELRVTPFRPQAHLHTIGDLACLMLIAHASGGPEGPLALALVIAIGIAAVLHGGRAAVGYAAAGVLLVLGEAIYASWTQPDASHLANSGFLGAALLLITLLVMAFERRAAVWEHQSQAREREVRYLSELALRVIEQTDNGIVVSDPDGRIDYINAAARQMLGDNEATIEAPAEARLPDLHEGVCDALRAWHAGDGSQQQDFDRPRRLRAQFHRIETALGPRALIVLQDLSAEDERVRRDKLAALGRLIASIAHEVRNPLSSIRQAAELLPESDTAAEREQLTTIITRHSDRINRLVEDVLGAARSPAVNAQNVELGDWLERFAESRRQNWRAGGKPYVMALTTPMEPAFARVDTTHLWQVIDNLCDNAERHGRPDDGQLRLRLRLETAPRGGWQIRVCDNGPRIADVDRSALFEPFFTTHSQGTGLGLFVSRELALANRGELALEEPDTSRDTGNCFRLCLPAADATETATTQARE